MKRLNLLLPLQTELDKHNFKLKFYFSKQHISVERRDVSISFCLANQPRKLDGFMKSNFLMYLPVFCCLEAGSRLLKLTEKHVLEIFNFLFHYHLFFKSWHLCVLQLGFNCIAATKIIYKKRCIKIMHFWTGVIS